MAINYKFNDVPQASVQLRTSGWVLTNPQRYRTPSVPRYNLLCNEYTASFLIRTAKLRAKIFEKRYKLQ